MTSIFSQATFFQKENENQTCNEHQGQYSFGQPVQFAPNQLQNQHFQPNVQFQREQEQCKPASKTPDEQMSLFVDNLIFEDKNTNDSEDLEQYDNDTCAQIESDILNMIDDEPLENIPNFEKADTKSDQNSIIGGELTKPCCSPRNLSPLCIKSQASYDTKFQSLFSASSNEAVFNSPTPCQQTLHQDVQIQDFNKLLEETSEDKNQTQKSVKNESEEEKPVAYHFPDGGWECQSCSNYNFKGRKQCYRCKKDQDNNDTNGKPQHMFQGKVEKAALKAAKQLTRKQRLQLKKNPKPQATEQKQQNQGKPRPGDWNCYRCQNFNYSFRESCNKCGLFQQESNFYTLNFAPNSINWNMNLQPQFNQQMPQTMPYSEHLSVNACQVMLQYQHQQQACQVQPQPQPQQFFYPQPTYTQFNNFVQQPVYQQQQPFC